MAGYDEKRAAFQKRLKVDVSNQQRKAAKQAQFSSNNANSSSNNSTKGDAPDRQRSKTTGRGNERWELLFIIIEDI